jgi:hypothetical protein
MRTTQKKGDLAKARAIQTFTSYGYDVGILITESAAYDLLVDYNGVIKRIQAKFNGDEDKCVSLRRIHSNSKGYVIKKYAENSYDWIYVLYKDGTEYLIKECLAGRSTVNVNDNFRIEKQLDKV